MTVITTRIYDTPQSAKGAVTKLKKSRVADDQIAVVAAEGKSPDDVTAAIAAIGIPAANAKALAESVSRGNTLVAVCPLFGKAYEAAEIMDSFSPVEGCELSTGNLPTDGSPALSGAAGWATLSSEATPLSKAMNWKLISDNAFPASKLFGWAMLSKSKFPASSSFSWNLLSDTKFPASSAFSWKLLSDEPTPLSSKYGWALLSKVATPLSDKLGVPLLSKK